MNLIYNILEQSDFLEYCDLRPSHQLQYAKFLTHCKDLGTEYAKILTLQSMLKSQTKVYVFPAYHSEQEFQFWHLISLKTKVVTFLPYLLYLCSRNTSRSKLNIPYLKDKFCFQFFRPRTHPRTFLQCFALESCCTKA